MDPHYYLGNDLTKNIEFMDTPLQENNFSISDEMFSNNSFKKLSFQNSDMNSDFSTTYESKNSLKSKVYNNYLINESDTQAELKSQPKYGNFINMGGNKI